MWDAEAAGEMPDVAMNPRLHALQGELRGKHLVIDAARQVRVLWHTTLSLGCMRWGELGVLWCASKGGACCASNDDGGKVGDA